MKHYKQVSASEFETAFYESVSCGKMNERLGKYVSVLIKNNVKSRLGNKCRETRDIICSDITLEIIVMFNKHVVSRGTINNPLAFFVRAISNTLSTIILQRFSSASTRDVFGYSILSGKGKARFEEIKNENSDEECD